MTAALDRRPLAIPAFRRLWWASAVGSIGGSFSVVAVPAQLYGWTGSSAVVAVASAVAFVALAGASPWVGGLADRVDRRVLLLAAHCGLAGTYLALWAYAALGGRSVVVVLALVAGQGVSFGALTVSVGAALPRLVPVELLPAANGLGSVVRYAGSVLGPVLAGALIPVLGLGTLYLLDGVALAVAAVVVAGLPPIAPEAVGGRGSRREGSSVAAGLRYLLGSRLLLGVLAVDLAATVFGMPFAVFPELAQRGFGGSAGGGPELGLLYAAWPAGVFLTGLVSGAVTRVRRHGAVLLMATAAWGVAVAGLGLAPWLWLGSLALVLGGAATFFLSAFRNAITQAYPDDVLRGRVQGVVTVVVAGGPHLGGLLHGLAAAGFGARPAVWLGGVLVVLAVAGVGLAVPWLWRYTAPPSVHLTAT